LADGERGEGREIGGAFGCGSARKHAQRRDEGDEKDDPAGLSDESPHDPFLLLNVPQIYHTDAVGASDAASAVAAPVPETGCPKRGWSYTSGSTEVFQGMKVCDPLRPFGGWASCRRS